MPEQLKPCPFCGAQPALREDIYGSSEYLASINCPCINGDVAESYFLRSGETQKQATNKSIAAWNTRTESLPRALRWTHEPPKVAGWYWFSVCKGHAVCILVCADGKAKLAKDHFTDAELLGGEWADPIPTPLELEES